MRSKILTVCLLWLFSAICRADPLGTAFTYQGQLAASGVPANGSYDFTFTLYAANSSGTALGAPLLELGTGVTNGLFVVDLDFGSQFGGEAAWLEIGVRSNNVGDFVVLAPRQQLTPTPNALYAASAGSATTASNVANGSITGPSIAPGAVAAANIAPNQVVKSLNGLQDAVILAQGNNVTITPNGNTLTIASSGGGGSNWSLTGNSGTIPGNNFLGTTDNQALEFHLNGLFAMRLEPGNGYGPNFIAGASCSVETNIGAATICGGWDNFIQAGGSWGTIAGGSGNRVSGANSFAAGQFATAVNDNSFVWNDGSSCGMQSFAQRQFVARASGGVMFLTSDNACAVSSFATGSAGAALAPGATAWSSVCDRDAKKNFKPLDVVGVLEKLNTIQISRWNYRWESDHDVANIGPMAQDFKTAFYPGRDDKSITTLEFDGVELAAIQGLSQKLSEREAELQELRKSVAELQRIVSKLARDQQ
jgi:hypothetical protein